MRCLMVSSYHPTRCGVAAYAAQSVKKMREQGRFVDVLSPDGQGEVDFRCNLLGKFRFLRLVSKAIFYDKVIVQYTPYFFLDQSMKAGRFSKITSTLLAFIMTFALCRNIEIVLHEFCSRRRLGSLDRLLNYISWRLAPKIIVHTVRNRHEFLKHYYNTNVVVKTHHEDFTKFREIAKPEARRELNIPNGDIIFLAIGFIQPSKGCDRLIRAFNKVSPENAKCYIVGALRYESGDLKEYLDLLGNLAAENQNVLVRNQFVSDEEFDTYVAAADYVVLPYNIIWSSSVLGRAKLFNKKVIAANTGGLPDQVDDGDFLFDNDEELEQIISKITGENDMPEESHVAVEPANLGTAMHKFDDVSTRIL